MVAFFSSLVSARLAKTLGGRMLSRVGGGGDFPFVAWSGGRLGRIVGKM